MPIVTMVRAGEIDQTANPPVSPTTRILAATLKGKTEPDTKDVGPAGQCNRGYADQCPSGNCSCEQIVNGIEFGNLNGTGIATEFFITSDDGAATNALSGLGGTQGWCRPQYGTVTLIASSGETKTLDLVLSRCTHLNPSPPDLDLVLGGFGIAARLPANPAAYGWGSVRGAANDTTNAIIFDLSGSVTQFPVPTPTRRPTPTPRATPSVTPAPTPTPA